MELAKKPISGCGGVGARSWVHSGFGDTGVEGMFDVPGWSWDSSAKIAAPAKTVSKQSVLSLIRQ